jgi:hypothetical protein
MGKGLTTIESMLIGALAGALFTISLMALIR